jgi:DHA1 family bicyclomycin/chloramphenicol resistance-like MFS transporter
MTEYFGTEYRVMQLSVALFLACSAVLQLVIGPLADKWGRRAVILGGLGLFALATLGCILAPTAEIFLTFRMGQAVIAVAMVLSRAAVRDQYSQDQAASMLGYVTMGIAVIPMIGPAIGGMLDELFGWQANFWLLLGLGLGGLALAWFDFGETATASGLSLLQQFRQYPELLRSPRFWGYSLASAFSSGAFFAFLGGAPFVGTDVYDLAPGRLGFYFGIPAIGYFLGNFLSGRFAARVGANRMILAGGLSLGAGIAMALLANLTGQSSAEAFFFFMAFIGIGNGLANPSAMAGSMSVRPHLAGTAAGLSGAIMLGGGAGFSALAGAMLTPESGALPLLILMLVTSVLCVASILMVIARDRQIGL